jgi:hypothetical protein
LASRGENKILKTENETGHRVWEVHNTTGPMNNENEQTNIPCPRTSAEVDKRSES